MYDITFQDIHENFLETINSPMKMSNMQRRYGRLGGESIKTILKKINIKEGIICVQLM